MREPVILPNVSGALLPQPEPKALAVQSLWRFGFFVFGQGGRRQGFAPHVHRVTISGNGLNIHGIVLILVPIHKRHLWARAPPPTTTFGGQAGVLALLKSSP